MPCARPALGAAAHQRQPAARNPWFEECLRGSPFERDTSNSITDTRSEAELQRINDRYHDRRWLERFVKGRQSL